METNLMNQNAPSFKGINQNGNILQLSDFKGKKLALYFYPKDMTPGCTSQACNLSENYAELKSHNIAIVGVSADEENRHLRFIEKYNLPFDLIADTEHVIADSYAVWQLKKFMGKEYMGIVRTTFLINENGVVEHIISKPKVKDHAQQIIDTWKESL